MKKNNNFFGKLLAWLRELVRKFIVKLKKNPSLIPMALLLVSFLVYSLNLTIISNTTATVQGKGMGLCEFAIMLGSLLSMICLLNAFPKRQKPNYKMIALLMVLFAVIIYCDINYYLMIGESIVKFADKIKEKQLTEYLTAQSTVITNAILVAVTAVAVILEPVYAKLLKKINTSVDLEETSVGNIELSDEE